MVGKILAKRYVLLEELEAVEAPAGTRFLAYDMNSLSRIKVRVHQDDEGELNPERFELEQAEDKANVGKAAPAKKVPAKEQPPAPNPEGAKTLPLPMLGKSPAPEKEAKTIPFPSLAQKAKETAEEPDAKTIPMQRLPDAEEPEGKTIPMQRPPEAKAPTLGDALDRAFGSGAEPPLPADSTQPLRLAEMEELAHSRTPAAQEDRLEVEPSRPMPGRKGRPETRRIEAAWFAMGDEMSEDEDAAPPPPEAPSDVEAAQLWQQASSLSRDEYRRFALDLSPPAPPPAPAAPAAPAAPEGNPDKAVAGEIVAPAPATAPPPPRVPERQDPAPVQAEESAAPTARPQLQIIEPSAPPSPSRTSDSTSYIQQEMGVISPVERVKRNRFFRWSINTRAGTFVLGAVVGTLLTLLVSC